MKAYDLKPTYENLLATYKENTIGRNEDIFRFISILNTVEDACSIALDGKWGSGKTFFVKQAKMVMDAYNNFICEEASKDKEEIKSVRKKYSITEEFEPIPQVCVYYDAWENDNDDDPVMSLVYSILHTAETDFPFKNVDLIKKGAKIIDAFTGKNWSKIVELLMGDTPLKNIEAQKDIEKMVDEFLKSLLPEKGNRLVVFIDELDRCKPSYAVQLLERIKHYFDHDEITFVFSVNINELIYTIKKHYGEEFDSDRYLDRFFDLKITLPQPDYEKFYRSIHFFNTYDKYNTICDAVIKTYHFELREIAKFIRISRIAARKALDEKYNICYANENGIVFAISYIVPIMLGLRVCDAHKYMDFIEGRDYTPLLEISEKVKDYGYFDGLLNYQETYDANRSGRKVVTIKEKLNLVYDAIFVKTYSRTIEKTSVGSYVYSQNTRNEILRIAGLLSKYVNTEID